MCQTNSLWVGAHQEYFLGEDMGYIRVPLEGVKVTIIDFTLSRCENEQGVLMYNKMEDEALFTGEGDYQ
ncbi:hypothetical protein HDU99_008504, partial [Rhizoclosmatium hyalinum]